MRRPRKPVEKGSTYAHEARESVTNWVMAEIKSFLTTDKESRKRFCTWCGRAFIPRMRYHFFCDAVCRRRWYGGWFHPRGD